MTPSTRAALQQLAVTLTGLVIVASLVLWYALSVKAEMMPPAVEVPLPEPDPHAAWDGIPLPPFRSTP